MSPAKNTPKSSRGEERRRAKRVVVLESFPLFLVIPNVHGMVRIYLRDISKLGLSFRTELERDFQKGQKLSMRLYTTPAFYLPLESEVVRVSAGEVAVQFSAPESKAAIAVARLIDFFDAAVEAGEIQA